MNRPPIDPGAARGGDGGRTILEALVGLALVALAVVSWGRMSTSAAQASEAADANATARDLATTELEILVATDWDELAIDPASDGYVRRFERRSVVADPAGLPAEIVVDVDGRTYTARRLVVDSGSPHWRRLVVEVTWDQRGATPSVRIDGAARRPAEATS